MKHHNGPKVKFGSALKDTDKVQKFSRTDPHRNVPFEGEPMPSGWVAAGIVLAVFAVGCALTMVL